MREPSVIPDSPKLEEPKWKPSAELVVSFEKWWDENVRKIRANPKARGINLEMLRPMAESAFFTGASCTTKGAHECIVCHQNTDLTPEQQKERAQK